MKVKIGFIGVGWMGEQLFARLMQHPDADILAVLDTNSERAHRILDAHGLPKSLFTRDYRDLLENPDINAIFVVSPNALHGPQSIAALDSGKHVFCEKPCATRFEDYVRQKELAESNPKLVTMVDYIMFFDDMENRLHTMVQQGFFGQVTQIQINYRHPVNIQGDKVWKLRKDLVGDGIGMGPIHAIFTLLWHMEPDRPVAVYATAMDARVRGFEVPPIWNFLLEFESGAAGIIQGNIDNGNRYDAFHNLYGTRGGFVFDSQTEHPFKVKLWSEERTGNQWVYPFNPDMTPEEHQWTGVKSPDSGDVIHHQTTECVDYFIRCIIEERRCELGFVNAGTAGEVAFAAMVSHRLKRRIELPLDEELATRVLTDLR
jgi:predicted dehydrogenase